MTANVTWSESRVTRNDRWALLGRQGITLWFTGLSGAGKSTIASRLEEVLLIRAISALRLDGDNIRHGLCSDLGFSAEDRAENIRRIGEVAKLFAESGTIAITSFISPYRSDRNLCRKLHEDAGIEFVEVWVDAPLDVCESRDPKGLYKKARTGEIREFTGITAPYEPPERPELILRTNRMDVDQCVDVCVQLLERRGIVEG